MRTVLLIRHGAVAGDAAHRFIGHTDLPMSADGETQIRELSRRLKDRMPPDAIYCSDLIRSRRTAELLADGRAIPLRVQPELREINLGAWEGLSRREVAEQQPAEYERRGRYIENFRPPGGESFATSPGASWSSGRALPPETPKAPSPSPRMPGSIASSSAMCSACRSAIFSGSLSVPAA